MEILLSAVSTYDLDMMTYYVEDPWNAPRSKDEGRDVLDIKIRVAQDEDVSGIWEPELCALAEQVTRPLLPLEAREHPLDAVYCNIYKDRYELPLHRDLVPFSHQFLICLADAPASPLMLTRGREEETESIEDFCVSINLRPGDVVRWHSAEQKQFRHGGIFNPGRKTLVVYYKG